MAKPTYRYEVDGRELLVFDDVLESAEIDAIHAKYQSSAYPRSESDRSDTKHVRTFAVDTPLDDFKRTRLYGVMEALVHEHFPEDLTSYRSYCNLIVYGDQAYAHRDCAPDRRDVTALYFANAEWSPDWGGETLFINDRQDCTHAVSPRRGRLCLFRGAIEHRVGIPTRVCFESRLTIACKFKEPGEWR